jgi:tellurite resistance protein
VSAIVFGILLILYTLKAILHPTKVLKEWRHPVFHNSFCLVPLCVLLWIPLTVEKYEILAEVLFWFSAPMTLFLSMLSFARLIFYPQFQGFFTPMIMMPALANLVAAFAMPVVVFRTHYINPEVSLLWLSQAVFLWVVLSAVTLQRLLTGSLSTLNEGARAGLWIYVAAPAIICAASALLMGPGSILSIFAFYITIVFFLGMVVLAAWAVFGREKWSMAYWSAKKHFLE